MKFPSVSVSRRVEVGERDQDRPGGGEVRLGSTNGTAVDGAVGTAGALRPLQAGARLRLGDIELSVGYG